MFSIHRFHQELTLTSESGIGIGIGIGIGLLKIHIAASKAELHEITV